MSHSEPGRGGPDRGDTPRLCSAETIATCRGPSPLLQFSIRPADVAPNLA